MPFDILVPPLSQTMDSLILIQWIKKVGDPVSKGEVLFLVETDKATLEVEAPDSGILSEILAEPGAEVKVRSKIGSILRPGEAMSIKVPESQRQQRIFASPRARRLAAQEKITLDTISATGPRQMIVERDVRAYVEREKPAARVTPLAKRIADGTGVDLSALTQAGKRITRADVEAALNEQHAEPPPAPASMPRTGKRVAMSNMRKTIARRMQESHLASAPVTLTRLLDATELKRVRERILKQIGPQDPRPTYTDFLVKIVARSLLDHPALNATFDGESIEMFDEIHMGLAVDTERGLTVPVIRSAQGKGLLELAHERGDLARRAAEGTLSPTELSGGTFSLTNLGALGVDTFTPIINPPQIAILGVGRIYPAPAAFEGQIALREMLNISLTFDHRAVDGAPASRLLQDIVRRIENPDLIWL